MTPLLWLASGVLAALAAFVLLRPGTGMWWQWTRALRATERVQIEDALKHLHDCEYRGLTGSLQSLAGALGISGNRAAEVLQRLQQHELVLAEPAGSIRLTQAGRTYALRIVRSHRLWETYLSDRTGLVPAEWHFAAERLEHTTSRQQAEALAESMGYPRFDPHGDPIPTAAGEIAPPRGRSLAEAERDRLCEIVHVEDEPEAVYAQLLAEGLHLGVRVRVLDVGPQRIRIMRDSRELELSPVVAANLSVVPVTDEDAALGTQEPLAALAPGETAWVTGISPAYRGVERRRLLDLGLVPGTVVSAEMVAPSGDPIAYRVRGALIALRREQAERIFVDRSRVSQEGVA